MALIFSEVLERLAGGGDLSPDMAAFAFEELMSGSLTPAQAGAFLMGLRAKGETAAELAAGVRAALARARLVPGLSGPRVDTCGTGGDKRHSFNCSTIVALFLADLGHTVVKHGNRAVSSSCGSADALEALGLPIGLGPEEAARELARTGFVFLFAPGYHPAFAHVAPIRRELNIRTLFNLMGPLLNPARPTHQILGVPSEAFARLMAEALVLTGVEKAAVVFGAGGFDELTPFGVNVVYMVTPAGTVRTELDPVDYGFPRHDPDSVSVQGKEAAVAVLREILAGRGPRPMRDMAALNLAMALHLLTDSPLSLCADQAREALDRGLTRLPGLSGGRHA